jgi:hypothetical protein
MSLVEDNVEQRHLIYAMTIAVDAWRWAPVLIHSKKVEMQIAFLGTAAAKCVPGSILQL